MADRQTNKPNNPPRHWVGVEKGWESLPGSPLDRLVPVPPERLKTHALVIGATGSGKTNLLHHLIAQDIINGHSFAVLDMRGDLVGDVAGMCHGRVHPARARIIDLRSKKTATRASTRCTGRENPTSAPSTCSPPWSRNRTLGASSLRKRSGTH